MTIAGTITPTTRQAMAEVIDIFSGKALQKEEVAPYVAAMKPTFFSLSPVPGKVTQEQVMTSKDHNFREDWLVTLASYRKLKLKITEIKRHEVTLSDIGKAIAISAAVKGDTEAVEYFTALSTVMATTQQFYLELGNIPDTFKGYVWSLNFQIIINAAAFAEYQLGSILGKQITRHIYF